MDKSLPTKLYSPNSNKYGPIAESYEELQGLHLLKEFKDQNNLPKASSDSLLRAIFQATEIAIINISILMDRISVERLEHDLRKVIEDFHWIYSLHKLLSKISSLPKSLGFEADFYGSKKRISITKSKAFVKYLETIKCTDEKMLSSIFLPSNFTAREISLTSLENPVIQILQLLRLCNQSAKGWEERLSQVPAPKSMDSHNNFVGSDLIEKMVFDRDLTTKTYFTQFRALHQIPEILTDEVNDQIENSILNLRASNYPAMHECLRKTNLIFPCIIESMLPISQFLTASEYYKIRENLGMTSGSHSKAIHYDLFRDLYNQLGENYLNIIDDDNFKRKLSGEGHQHPKNISEFLQFTITKKDESESARWLSLIGQELINLHGFVFEWREQHMNLPRNVIGGNSTKSLQGAADAIKATENMKQKAAERMFEKLFGVKIATRVAAP